MLHCLHSHCSLPPVSRLVDWIRLDSLRLYPIYPTLLDRLYHDFKLIGRCGLLSGLICTAKCTLLKVYLLSIPNCLKIERGVGFEHSSCYCKQEPCRTISLISVSKSAKRSENTCFTGLWHVLASYQRKRLVKATVVTDRMLKLTVK